MKLGGARVAIVCALASGVAFFFSIGLGEQSWLAWLAPVPVLWLAFGETKSWQVFLAAWAAGALGLANQLSAYGAVMPVFVLVLGLGAPSLLFALAVLISRHVQRAVGPLAGVLGFAVGWAALDFLGSFNADGGAIITPAMSQVGMPLLIQCASLFGPWSITFLLGFFAAGIALSLRTRAALPVVLAIALFAVNAGFGAWRMSTPPSATMRVALIDSDALERAVFSDKEKDTAATIAAYARAVAALRGQGVKLIVLPEKLAIVEAPWRADAWKTFSAATREAGAILIAGLDARDANGRHNVAWAFAPNGGEPVTYTKRRLVTGLESHFARGPGPLVLDNGIGLEICKDMDYQVMLRHDMTVTKPILLAVPAWDFGADRVYHARSAILRSVENGVPMARAAREGLLTLSDRYGRVVLQAETGDGFVTRVGELPLDGRGGDTLYDRIGDVFGWLCVAVTLGLIALSFAQTRRGSLAAAPPN